MNITDETTSGLRLLAGIQDGEFEALVDASFDVLLKVKTEECLKEGVLAEVDPLKVKRGFATVLSIVVEGGKANSPAIQISGLMQEYKVSAKKRQYFTERYETDFKDVRKLLSKTGFNFPNIVDVDWRMDYCVKSSAVGKVGKPIYFVSLQTEDTPKVAEGRNVNQQDVASVVTDQVEFSCNIEELQDLVSKLKDASKQMERLENEYGS